MNVYDLINCAGEKAEPAWVHSYILCDIAMVIASSTGLSMGSILKLSVPVYNCTGYNYTFFPRYLLYTIRHN
jgi:hypothetical protein